MVEIRLLGSIDVRGSLDRRAEAVVLQPKRIALLAYLAAASPRGYHAREVLVGLLWPELDESHARAALRQSIHGLRQALGPELLLMRGDTLALNPAHCEVDVQRFDDAVTHRDCERAVALYGGEFVAGLYVSGSPDFQQWLDTQRHRRAREYLDALTKLAATAGDAATRLQYLQRNHEQVPYDPSVTLTLMEELCAGARQHDAIRVGEHYTERVQELGDEPDHAVSALLRQIRETTRESSNETVRLLHSQRKRPVRLWRAFAVIVLLLGAGLLYYRGKGASTAAGERQAVDPAAQRLYEAAMANHGLAQASLRQTIERLERAVQRDRTFALAWAMLGFMHAEYYWFHYDPSPARLAAAEAAINTAEKLSPELAEVHLAKGYYLYWGRLDYAGALAEFNRAQRRAPRNAEIPSAIANVYRRMGDWRASTRYQEQAIKLEPRNARHLLFAALNYRFMRDFKKAEETYTRVLAIDPANRDAYTGLAFVALYGYGDADSARVWLERAERMPIRGEVPNRWPRVLVELHERDFVRALDLIREDTVAAYSAQPVFIPRTRLAGQISQRLGDTTLARIYFDSARAILDGQLASAPWDARFHSAYGRLRAAAGDEASAISAGRRALELMPVSVDAFRGGWALAEYAEILAHTRNADSAIVILQYLLKTPSTITTAALRQDPAWDPLRNHSAFRRLTK